MFDDSVFYYGSKANNVSNFLSIEEDAAWLILEDLSFLRADAVFEVMEARKLMVFHEDEHLERLFNSAGEQALFIKDVSDNLSTFKKFFKERIQKVLKRNGNKSCTIRVMITGGITWNEFESKGPSVFIMTRSFKDPGFNKEGLKLLPIYYEREFSYIKSINYQFAERSLRQNPEYDDVLYLKRNSKGRRNVGFSWLDQVLESSRSNLFWFVDNKIITPEKDILHGVTRNIILKLAEDTGYKVEREKILWGGLVLRDLGKGKKREVFLTNTTFFVNPVRQIGDIVFPVGPATKIFWHLFTRYREDYYNRHVDMQKKLK